MRLSTKASNASVDAVTQQLAGGSLRIFGGNPPSAPDGGAGDAQLLAELKWPAPAFPPAKSGLAVSYPMTSATALASGNPTWAQAVTADGSTVFDELVNQGDRSLTIDPAWIEAGGPVVVDHIAYSA